MRHAYRNMCFAFLLTLAAGPARAADRDFLEWQAWLLRAEQAAHGDVAAALCGLSGVDSRAALLVQARAAGADDGELQHLARRYEETLLERRRLEAALSASSPRPQRSHGWVFPLINCPPAPPVP